MKACVTITYTRHTGKFSKIGRTAHTSFDIEHRTLIEVAERGIALLDDYVRNTRLRKR